MRDPKRIKKILRLIRKIWLKNPGLRLCQLIENCADRGIHKLTNEPYTESMYYMEDEFLEKRLRKIYKGEYNVSKR